MTATAGRRQAFEELWDPTERQRVATAAADSHQFTLYGGFRGGGKSHWLRWWLLRQLLRLAQHGKPAARVGLFCETYPTLKDRQIAPIEREFPDWLGELRDTQETGLGYHLAAKYGGGVLQLRNLDKAGKYKSAEFAAIGVDQLEQNPKETFDLLRGSLRWPGVRRPRFVASANPGGIGHLWVKQLWLDRDFPPEMRDLAEQFCFVESRPEDNPHLSPSYWEMLETLPEGLRQAWRYGNWDIFEGQAFPEWRREVHVVDPFAIPEDWPRFRALDYGYQAPSCVGWFACDPLDPRRLYLYRELYETGLGPAELAERIRELTTAEEWIGYTAADPSIFRTSEQTKASNADVLAANGVPCIAGHNDRVSGWRLLHEYLQVRDEPVGGAIEQMAFLRIFRNCTNTIRTLPAVVYEPNRPEDVDSGGEDHAPDMLRYAVMSRPALRLTLAEQKLPRLPRYGKGWDPQRPQLDQLKPGQRRAKAMAQDPTRPKLPPLPKHQGSTGRSTLLPNRTRGRR